MPPRPPYRISRRWPRSRSPSSGSAATLYGDETAPLFPALLRAPVSTGAPGVSGGAKVGRQLTCQLGQWAPDLSGGFLFHAPRAFAVQWIQDGAEIAGATQPTFTPTTAGAYSCRVTASNAAGATSRTSTPKRVKVGKSGA